MPLVQMATKTLPGSAAYSGERIINGFARPTDAISPVTVLGRGGLVEHVTLSKFDPIEAMIAWQGALYVACAGRLWKVADSVVEDLGEIPRGTTYMAATAQELAITVDSRYFLWDGSTLATHSTGSVTSPTCVVAMDGYFIVSGTARGRGDAFTISGLDNGATFAALDFAFAQAADDPIVQMLTDQNRLWLFGSRSVQQFFNSGAADFPIEPIQGSLIEHGCVPQTAVRVDNTVIWVRPDGAVLRSGGQAPEVISPPEIVSDIASIGASRSFTFSERGHEFYAIWRTDATTLVFDLRTGAWHERVDGVQEDPWAAMASAQVSGVQYLGCLGGQVATLSASAYTDFGDPLKLEVTSPAIQQGGDHFAISRMTVSVAAGDARIDRQPQVMLEVSRDGRTWTAGKWRALGNLGDYARRAAWHGLGSGSRFQVRMSITDPVPRDVIGVEYV